MELLVAKWYESDSLAHFLITIALAMAMGAAGLYATLKAANPTRRLSWGTRRNTSLYAASHRETGALVLTHGGEKVDRPRLVDFRLTNDGRRDITADMFHGNEPIQFDLGINVVGVLASESSPASTVAPGVTVSGQRISVAPFLFKRRQTVSIVVLVDGPEAKVTCTAAPLVEVKVRERDQTALDSGPTSHMTSWMAATTTGAVIAYLAFLLFQDTTPLLGR
ncbi:hypothetical protein [Streptomyces sp. NPDC059979]|uniref:hypothetical protein n=1 Tax=Streptomyces sp. NPDC059979 TaxID=3347021 RepID=UPI003692DF0B